MIEIPDTTSEKKPVISATDKFVMDLNPTLWKKCSRMSPEGLFDRWLELTQENSTELKETELIMLNHLFIPKLDYSGTKQRGLFYSPNVENGKDRLNTFEDLINNIKTEIEMHYENTSDEVPFNIMISGLGASGKSTIRSSVTGGLIDELSDCLIAQVDNDYQDPSFIHQKLQGKVKVVNIIEDVHGLDDKKIKSSAFNMIIYVLPTINNYKTYLNNRANGWKEVGINDLTARQDEDSPKQTAQEITGEMENESSEWRKCQMETLKRYKGEGGITIIITSSDIINKLYGLGEIPEVH